MTNLTKVKHTKKYAKAQNKMKEITKLNIAK